MNNLTKNNNLINRANIIIAGIIVLACTIFLISFKLLNNDNGIKRTDEICIAGESCKTTIENKDDIENLKQNINDEIVDQLDAEKEIILDDLGIK